jgi:hypothetical protein
MTDWIAHVRAFEDRATTTDDVQIQAGMAEIWRLRDLLKLAEKELAKHGTTLWDIKLKHRDAAKQPDQSNH